jgi:sec-independent protein translocase protein TatA
MIGDLFDSPWKIAIIAILIIVLFGAKKMPDAARSLGKSMRILKSEVQGLHNDDAPSAVPLAQDQVQAQLPAPQQTVTAQAQIDALSKQLADLQQTVGNGTAPANGTVPADTPQAK